MFCRLYGLSNCSVFKVEWVLVAHHILLTGESFNWAQILSVNLKEEIEKYQKTSMLKLLQITERGGESVISKA